MEIMYVRKIFQKYPLISLLLTSILTISACGGDNGGSAPEIEEEVQPVPIIGEVLDIKGVVSFGQTIAAADGNSEQAPGQANFWDLDSNFSIIDGYDDQFDGALNIDVTVDAVTESFPNDQTEAEVSYYGPLMGSAEGVKGVEVSSGAQRAYIYGTHENYLQQSIDLTTTTNPTVLTWSSVLGSNEVYGISGVTHYYRAVLRDGDGNLLANLYEINESGASGTPGTADISAYTGQVVTLSFEVRRHSGYVAIDDVSVTDDVATQFIANGDFATGDLTGWTAREPSTVQNVTSGTRVLNGIEVTRSFYTVPNKTWGRWVDVYTNPTASDIVAKITYNSNLGSDSDGIIYETPNTNGKGLTTWDGDNSDRDVGFAFGSAEEIYFLSEDGIGNGNGDDDLSWSYNVTIPAGGTVSIVNFIVMNGTDTSDIATDITARATDIDNDVAAIVNGYSSDVQYRHGMTQKQLDTVINMN